MLVNINSKYYIRKNSNTIETNLFNDEAKIITPNDFHYHDFNQIYNVCRRVTDPINTRNRNLRVIYTKFGIDAHHIDKYLVEEKEESKNVSVNVAVENTESAPTNSVKVALQNMIKFFSEFNYTPSFRFVNTFTTSDDPKEYTKNYFEIQNNSYTNEIIDRMESLEFETLVNDLKHKSTKKINTRLKLYYGDPGTGKTTKAVDESSACIVCASDMLPKDLMQNFTFNDGKAAFEKSDLWKAMENGTTITLDEINMLPFESLKFLQGITDNKESLDFAGEHIKIHPDFNIIGTMNLSVNNNIISIPEPLADRCSEIKEFKLTADDLLKAII